MPLCSSVVISGIIYNTEYNEQGLPGGSVERTPPPGLEMQDTGSNLRREDPGEGNGKARSSILAWEIPGTQEPGRLRSMVLQSVRHGLGDRTTVTTANNSVWV